MAVVVLVELWLVLDFRRVGRDGWYFRREIMRVVRLVRRGRKDDGGGL